MATLAFIGLASNILQFVQLGTQLVLEARQLYKSASGTTAFHGRVEVDTENLKSLMEQIQTSKHSIAVAFRRTKAENQLLESAKSCAEVAKELLDLLEASKVKNASGSRLRAIKQAFYNESTRDQVAHLQRHLKELQATTMLHFIMVLRDDQSAICRSISDLTVANQRLEANTTIQLNSIHRGLIHIQNRAEEDAKNMASLINAMRHETMDVKKQQKFLKGLQFPEIKVRHESIKAAHARTFEWIHSRLDFAHWLEEGDGIFWVRGKAGSGKSTLMRFLVENPTTSKMLLKWAGRRKLVLANHFFWKAGTPMQKSRTGLLRTLLFQILRQIPDLIEKLFPLRWEDKDVNLDSLTENELVQAIKALPLDDRLPVRFCFFIDGLDEYTTGAQRYHGDYQELIDLLEALTTSPVIKICVSSRPWTPFERAFGDSPNKLRLEDLTKNDIREYVLDKFSSSPYFQKLAKVDPRCKTFDEQIVQKAQGVFLWVFLVVESLLKGVSAADDFNDLQRRLNSIPTDLEDYFKHMLETIEPIYWEQTTRIFQVTVDAGQPLPLLGYELLDRERQKPDYALELSPNELLELNSQEVQNRTKIRLNARCRDLLEVVHYGTDHSFTSCKVEFLHRTVRDFFVENDFLSDMMKSRETNFDSQISLCRIMLALVQILHASRLGQSDPNTLFDLVDSLMYYVRQIEIDFISSERSISELKDNRRINIVHKLLDEVDRVNTASMPSRNIHWTNIRDPPRGMYQEYMKKTFLASTIEARLLLYVTAQLDAHPEYIRKKKGRPLLDYALRPTIVNPTRLTNFKEGPDFPLVELLLSKGADPNKPMHIYEGRTPWSLFLETCAQYRVQREIFGNVTKRPDDLYETLHLMISNDADWKQLYSPSERGASGTVSTNRLLKEARIPDIGLTDPEILSLNTLLAAKSSQSTSVSWLLWLWGRKGVK
ncbi:hypothetical protein F5Y09DRAFT_353517 [Xylaria sp. FL1042]|nr:hypothetical protein F5Y09DRAFT_353517 [Xylaria sp. FL1042]